VNSVKIAILGGGVTGLATAHFLREKGMEVHVFERDAVPGGLCRSKSRDGFTFDRAGGHIIFSKDPEVMGFVRSLLGEENMVQSERRTKIFYRGDYVKYPFENGLGDLPVEDRFECLKGYIEAHYRRHGGAEQPDNFRDWILWRFG
jgi:protoporphyrinogen oxidase